jgi:hypothetical protein
MLFWSLVAFGYLLLLGLGHLAGRHLAKRFGAGGGGGGTFEPDPRPDAPPGLAWAPLGSDFDRALLPDAFADGPARVG